MTQSAELIISVDSSQVRSATGDLQGLAGGAVKMLAPILSVTAALSALNRASDVQRQFDVLNAGLVTATRSSESAGVAFQALSRFAAKTPYDLSQAVEGFTKLVNLGLTPSEAALTSYGNTAAALGKDLNSMIEAVADAATGEFERLKEFGIKAKSEGDDVSLTFQGVTTKIGKNAAEIEKYLIGIGQVNFAGAMSARMDTLDGKVSNLADTWDQTYRIINDAGLGAMMKASVETSLGALEELNAELDSGRIAGHLSAIAGKFDGFGRDAVDSFEVIRQAWNDTVSQDVVGGIGYAGAESVDFLIEAFWSLPENIRASMQILTIEVLSGFDRVAAYASSFKDGITAIFTDDTVAGASERLEAELARLNEVRDSSLISIMAERDAAISSFTQQSAASDDLRKTYDERRKAESAGTVDQLADFKLQVDGNEAVAEAAAKTSKAAVSAASAQAKAFDSLMDSLYPAEAAQEKYNAQLALLEKYLSGDRLAEAVKELGKQFSRSGEDAKGASDAIADYRKQFDDLRDRLDPVARATRDYEADQGRLNEMLQRGIISVDEYGKYLDQLGGQYRENVGEVSLWEKMTEGATDRIDGAFADMWKGVFDGSKSTLEGMKDGLKQWLAEMAHMLITKPLMVSIGNAFTGGNRSGGIVETIGGLFGGGGGGGSSGGGGSGMMGMAQNLYSAYSAITGVGADIAAGYASGGITGAVQGGAGYYGNLLGNLGGTLSSGFSSVVGAITGQTAASAASAAAAQAAGAAAGNSLAVNAGAYAATSGAGSGMAAGMSSAMSSAAAMWPLAVIMGMWQSGKLYDAGVRADSDATLAAGGSTAAGEAVMAGPAMQSLQFEVIDSLLGGGKFAAIISGSTFHQALWSGIGGALFGGEYKTKNYGYEFGVDNGEFEGRTFQDQKKKGGLFSSSKSRTRYKALDPETAEYFDGLFAATELGVQTLYESLGVTFEEGALDGLNLASMKIKTKGKTEEEINKAIMGWFGNASDAMSRHLGEVAGAGFGSDLTTARLAELVQGLEGSNAVLETLNIGLLDISPAGALAADALLKLVGGFDAMAGATGAYYEAFYSDAEKWEDFTAGVTGQFGAIDLAIPDSREAFRGLVESLDLMEESGRNTFNQLMSLSPLMDQYYQGLEGQAQALAASTAALADSRQGGSDAVGSTIGGLRESVFMDLLAGDRERYDYQKAQADALAQMLPALTSVADITDVVNRITQLSSSVYGMLDEDGKERNGREMIEFLDQIQVQAQEQIAKSNEEMSAREAAILEAAINRATDKMANDLTRAIAGGNENQASLFATLGSIVNQFGAFTNQFGRSREVTG